MIKEIIIPDSLIKIIENLPTRIQKKFYWCIDILIKNDTYPSLRHKKIEGTKDYWEFSITMNYRAVYRREDGIAKLVAIGKHEDIF